MKVFLKINKKLQVFIIILLVILIISFIFIIINKFIIKKSPIKIGFVNTLTGSVSTPVKIQRDVAVFAIELINNKGGINGRKVELIIKDDKFDPEEALRVDKELINEGVVAIIGHTFSSLCLKVVPLINKHEILMIGPNVKSVELSRMNSNFLRLSLPLDKDSEAVAKIAVNKLNLRMIATVYDLINKDMTEPTSNYFKNEVERLGGNITANIPINTKEKIVIKDIVKKIINSNAEGVFIISDAIHSALFCQHIRMNNSKIKIITHGWAFADPTFIIEGGKSVEGVFGILVINKSLANEKYLNFEQKFMERYNEEISGQAQKTYEAMEILSRALAITDNPNPKKLRDIILKQQEFDGIDGKISFDKFGNPIRIMYIAEIRNGKKEIIGTFKEAY